MKVILNAGWINAKSIGITAFMANVVLRIPFFNQWPFIQRVRRQRHCSRVIPL